MAGKYTGLCNKLCKSILKNHNIVLLLEQEQFYSQQQDRVITMFVLSQRVWDESKGKFVKRQLLKTCSQVELVQFLGKYHKELNEAKNNT